MHSFLLLIWDVGHATVRKQDDSASGSPAGQHVNYVRHELSLVTGTIMSVSTSRLTWTGHWWAACSCQHTPALQMVQCMR